MGFSSRLSFPSPGDLPNPGIKPTSLKSPALAGGFFIPTNSHGQRKPSGGGCRSLRQEATVCPPEAADDLQGDLFHLSSTAITAEQLFFTCECRLCACGVCVHTQLHTHTLFLGPPFSLSIPSLSLQPHKQQAPKRSQPLQGRQPCLTVQRVEAALSLRGPGPTVGSPCQLPASPCPAGRARTCTV